MTTTFTIQDFPFDALRITPKKDCIKSADFGVVHQPVKVEVEGELVDFRLKWPLLLSDAASYYIPAGNSGQEPRLYLHPLVHPKWETTKIDADGVTTHTTSPTGLALEEFEAKFLEALNRECAKLSDSDRMWIMGANFQRSKKTDDTFVENFIKHPNYPKKHPKADTPNEDKSKTFAMSLWTQDVTKRAQTDKNKKKFPSKTTADDDNNPDSPTKTPTGAAELMIPGTNTVIYTSIYDMSKSKKRRASATGEVESGQKLTKYQDVKKFFYSASGEENASSTNSELLSEFTTLGPSICWKPAANVIATIGWKTSEMIVMSHKPRSYTNAISPEKTEELKKRTALAYEEYGIKADDDEEDDMNIDGGAMTNDANDMQFNSPLEKLNYESQQSCEKDLTDMDKTSRRLNDEKLLTKDPTSLRLIATQLTMLEKRRVKKEEELTSLQEELLMLMDQENNPITESTAIDEMYHNEFTAVDEAFSETQPAKKKRRTEKSY